MDWSPTRCRSSGDLERAERHAREDVPHAKTVWLRFGSWNAAIEAAGFEGRAAGWSAFNAPAASGVTCACGNPLLVETAEAVCGFCAAEVVAA